jgi:hypothetical protein
MPGYGHSSDCTCGWCSGGNRGSRSYGPSLPAVGTKSSWKCDDFCRSTSCPNCKETVYFVRYNGGSVWFDSLGKPWPKHACFPQDAGGVRLHTRLAEPVEQGTRLFGVVTATEVTRLGEAGRIAFRCSDGREVEGEYETTLDFTQLPGSLVVLNEREPGQFAFQRVSPESAGVEAYDCPKLGQPVIYDPRQQRGVGGLDTRVWLCNDARLADHRTFHIWRLVGHLDGLTAARLIGEYMRQVTRPTGTGMGGRILMGWENGQFFRTSTVEVSIFRGTPYEREFVLHAALSAKQIDDWVQTVEALLAPRRPDAGWSGWAPG